MRDVIAQGFVLHSSYFGFDEAPPLVIAQGFLSCIKHCDYDAI